MSCMHCIRLTLFVELSGAGVMLGAMHCDGCTWRIASIWNEAVGDCNDRTVVMLRSIQALCHDPRDALSQAWSFCPDHSELERDVSRL